MAEPKKIKPFEQWASDETVQAQEKLIRFLSSIGAQLIKIKPKFRPNHELSHDGEEAEDG